ncbi:MAG: porin [Flavobacteriaceae bacterium]|nr:porin [Flavobacteriaceae bacterium]MCB0484766.1 porin [Flavobacteriaceae bacterium]
MKTRIIFLFALAVSLLFSTNSFAQGCEDDAAPASGAAAGANNMTPVVFGFFQPEYDYHFADPDNDNSFYFKRARLGVRGKVSRSFSYYVMLEASDFIASDGNVYLLDAFVTYTKSDMFKVSMGSFKQPFGLEVETPCHGLTTINRSIVSNQLVSPQRDIGATILGKNDKFRYALALMNGRGLGIKDNNNKKDVIGRANYKLFDFMSVGASFRYGYPNNDDNDRTTYGFEAQLNYKGFNLQGEYIHDEGDYNRAAEGGCGSTPMELGEQRQGAYLMAWYAPEDSKLHPVFKYEYFDADLDTKILGYQELMTFGLNYFFNDKTRVQLNYEYYVEPGVSSYDSALLMQVQVKF